MSKIFERLKKMIKSLKLGFQRFPEVAFVSILIAIIGITLNHQNSFQRLTIDFLENSLLVLILMVPLASYGKLIYEKNTEIKWRIGLDFFAIGIGVLFYFNIPNNFNEQFAIQFASLFLSFTLILTLIHSHKKENYSLVVLDLISSFFITLLFSLVLFLGIISMLFTVEQLFELSINSDLYFDVYIIIGALFSVTYFFARLPRQEEEMEIFMYPNVLKGLINYIIIPLIIVYTGILYMYFIRIILLKTFPINLLSHLVMWYALISVVVLFFINKIKNENKILQVFYKFFPLAILVPLVMLFLAIGKRVADFSVTPLRYYVIVIGVWATISVLYIKFSKKFKSNMIVVAAIIIMLGSLYGPQSAFTLSRNLQENRLIDVLEKNNMIEQEKIISRSDLPTSEKETISDFIRYFSQYHDFDEIEILPKGFSTNDMKDVFGFEQYYPTYSPQEFISYNYMNSNMSLDISDYNYFLEMDFTLSEDKEYTLDNRTIKYSSKTNALSFYKNEKLLENINVIEMIETYHENHEDEQITSLEDATIEYNFDEIDIKIIISDIYYEKVSNNEGKPYSRLNFKMFLK